jgi:peptidyl-tRNA hydrolase, PTH2 family
MQISGIISMRMKMLAEEFTAKQVIVVRKDLKMETGKLVSQACHACLEASEESKKHDPRLWRIWRDEGAKKVVVKVSSLDELLDIKDKAERIGVPNALIVDRGLTQIPPNTPTALGIGPGKTETVDRLTKHLKLL